MPRRRRSTSSSTHPLAHRALDAASSSYPYVFLLGMITATDVISSAPSSLKSTLVATIHVTNAITLVVMTRPDVYQAHLHTTTPRGRRCCLVVNGISLDLGVRPRERGEGRRERHRPRRCHWRGSGRAGLAKLRIRLLLSPTGSPKKFAQPLGRTSKSPKGTKLELWRQRARRRLKIAPRMPQPQHQHNHSCSDLIN